MVRHQIYLNGQTAKIKNYKKLVKHLKKNRALKVAFLIEIAGTYSMFKSLLKMKDMKILNFEKDGMEENHIKFVDKLSKDFPILKKYIEESRLK